MIDKINNKMDKKENLPMNDEEVKKIAEVIKKKSKGKIKIRKQKKRPKS